MPHLRPLRPHQRLRRHLHRPHPLPRLDRRRPNMRKCRHPNALRFQQSENMADKYYPAGADGRLATKSDPNAPPSSSSAPPAPASDPNAPKIRLSNGSEYAEDYLQRAAAEQAARDVVRAALPDPSAYKVELPGDFKAPEGINFQLNQNDPLMAQARQVMHDIDTGKISGQEAFSKLLGLYAGAQVADAAMVKAGRDAEIAKLGPTGTARVTAVITFLKSHYGDEQGTRMASRIFTAQDVKDWERVVANRASQGAAGFSQKHRDITDPNRVDQATYDRMSYTERKDYAARFSQQR